MMNLFGKNKEARLLKQCTLPLTGAQVVKRLYTDFAVFELSETTPVVLDLAPGVTLNELSRRLNMSLQPSPSGLGTYC